MQILNVLSLSFDKGMYPCNRKPYQDTEHSTTSESSCVNLPVCPLKQTTRRATHCLIFSTINVLPPAEFHVSVGVPFSLHCSRFLPISLPEALMALS